MTKLLTVVLCLTVCLHVPLHAQAAKVVLQEINVKDGDTLWGIANYYLKDPRAWPEILKHNKALSSDPNVVLPGMTLKIPVLLVKEHLRPATLVLMLNDVRFKRKDTVRWQGAEVQMEFYNEDSLRTMNNAKANVRFLTGELIQVDENSLIVLRPEKKQEEVTLFSGSVRASKARVLTETTEVKPKVDPKSPHTDFKTKVKKDKTTLVQVYDGVVDVTAEGKTVTLTKGFGTEVKYLKPPSAPKLLPPEPKFDSAGSTKDTLNLSLDTSMGGGSSAEDVISTWEITEYHLQIAKDRNFNSVVIDRTSKFRNTIDIDKNKFNLNDGTYYYRVALVNELGFESQYNEPKMFVVDNKPPVMELYQPIENSKITERAVQVNGKTEVDAIITVNSRIVAVDGTGFFAAEVNLDRGINNIVVIAKDSSGNFVRLERKVYKIGGKVENTAGRISGERSSSDAPRWIKTPAQVVVTVATYIVIAVVIGTILF